MRIIGGSKKGYRIFAPKNLPTRPTTDRSKESLFNILCNRYDLENCHVLDLFAGTGNVTYEFASRGVKSLTTVDRHQGCISFIKTECAKLGFSPDIIRMDVFRFLRNAPAQYDIIFADPPYAMEEYPMLPQLVFEHGLLTNEGVFMMEHHSVKNFDHLPYFSEKRAYGQNVLSFFEPEL